MALSSPPTPIYITFKYVYVIGVNMAYIDCKQLHFGCTLYFVVLMDVNINLLFVIFE